MVVYTYTEQLRYLAGKRDALHELSLLTGGVLDVRTLHNLIQTVKEQVSDDILSLIIQHRETETEPDLTFTLQGAEA